MASLGKFQFDKATVISVAVVIALLGVGYGVGQLSGTKSAQDEIIEQGGQQQSLTGTVKSTNKDGFTLEIDKDAGGGTGGIGAAGSSAPEGKWTVKYGKQGANISGGLASTGGTSEKQELKKGDKVQVSGTPIGKNTVVAQSITKVVPPTPAPSASPGAKGTKPGV